MADQNSGNMTLADLEALSFESFGRDPGRDIVCVAPIRTMVRREEEIILIRRVRKVEEVDASPTCPVGSTQMTQVQQDGQISYQAGQTA